MNRESTFKRIMRNKATPLLIILIIMLIIAMIMTSGVTKGAPVSDMFTAGFMAKANIQAQLYKMVIQICMMCGLACIMITGNIDLSLAAQATLGALIFANCAKVMPWGAAVLIAFIAAVVFGLINTFMVNVLKFPSFIATIGISSVYGGFCNVITGGTQVQIAGGTGFSAIGTACIGPVPVMFIFAIVLLIIFQFVLSKTRFGRSMFMAGGNPMGARLCGLNPDRLRMVMFILNSVLAVLGGLLFSAQLSQAHPTSIITSAPNMTAMSATLLGGVAFMGGSGNLGGPLVAVILIDVFSNILDLLGVGSHWIILLNGVLLLVALVIDYVSETRRARAMILAATKD